MVLQSVIHTVYPAQCVACDAATSEDHGLCGTCWRETRFIHGLTCDKCGTPVQGEAGPDAILCDDCMSIARPWLQGRATLLYEGVGRRMVLGLKHGDRTDLVPALAKWMAQAARPLLQNDTLIVPVPLHWTRLLRRRYNQAALLARELAKLTGAACCLDALLRPRRTQLLEGHSRDARFAALSGAITAHPKRIHLLRKGPVLLIDDVMTSGATLAAATEACHAAGAQHVCVLTLARVAKDH